MKYFAPHYLYDNLLKVHSQVWEMIMYLEINLIFLIKTLFLHHQKVKIKILIFAKQLTKENSEINRWKKVNDKAGLDSLLLDFCLVRTKYIFLTVSPFLFYHCRK